VRCDGEGAEETGANARKDDGEVDEGDVVPDCGDGCTTDDRCDHYRKDKWNVHDSGIDSRGAFDGLEPDRDLWEVSGWACGGFRGASVTYVVEKYEKRTTEAGNIQGA
jgi:hypothetical protein